VPRTSIVGEEWSEFDARDADADVDDVESEFADIAKTPDIPHWLGSKSSWKA
jgi:hypothetical protein